jgi:hypothetical protein
MKRYRMRAKLPRADRRRPRAAVLRGSMLIDCEDCSLRALLVGPRGRLAEAGVSGWAGAVRLRWVLGSRVHIGEPGSLVGGTGSPRQ